MDIVLRNRDCDIENQLKGIVGFNMICSILKEPLFSQFKYIYLQALNSKLISYYSSFGFVSIDEKYPDIMLAEIDTLLSICTRQYNIPVLKKIEE